MSDPRWGGARPSRPYGREPGGQAARPRFRDPGRAADAAGRFPDAAARSRLGGSGWVDPGWVDPGWADPGGADRVRADPGRADSRGSDPRRRDPGRGGRDSGPPAAGGNGRDPGPAAGRRGDPGADARTRQMPAARGVPGDGSLPQGDAGGMGPPGRMRNSAAFRRVVPPGQPSRPGRGRPRPSRTACVTARRGARRRTPRAAESSPAARPGPVGRAAGRPRSLRHRCQRGGRRHRHDGRRGPHQVRCSDCSSWPARSPPRWPYGPGQAG